MAQLEDEFRHVLSSCTLDHEIEALADLGSLSMSSDCSSDLAASATDENDSISSGSRRSSYHSLCSIHEIDLLPPEAIADLRAIASRMAAAGYGRECVQVYASIRKLVVDSALCRLGIEKLSIGDIQRLK